MKYYTKEWVTVSRPSYFGKKRNEIEIGYDEKYGKGNWQIAYAINKRNAIWETKSDQTTVGFDTAIKLYEDAYYEYLKSNTYITDELVNTAEDVYDNAESNVFSGYDYHKQETSSNHYQDISIRSCIFRLGLRFKGKDLIQIRGKSKSKIGESLNPGHIPFHLPKYVITPVMEGWWDKGSVEEFWQSAKVLQVKKEEEETIVF